MYIHIYIYREREIDRYIDRYVWAPTTQSFAPYPWRKQLCIYIYIYIYRERERDLSL